MTTRHRISIARILVLALMFRVALGFGHGPMVAPQPDLLLQGFCGQLPESGDPGVPYQGCPICHALSYQADIEHGLSPVIIGSDIPPTAQGNATPAYPPPRIHRHAAINLPRAPPIPRLV